MEAKFTYTYSAPRWAKASGFIRQLALKCDVDCKIETTKGLITETGTFVCKGKLPKIEKFKKEFNSAIVEYNK